MQWKEGSREVILVLDAVQRESSPVFPASGSISPGSWTIACDTGLMLQRVFLR